MFPKDENRENWANFNCVDLCRDAAKHASMMALAAPSVLTTQQLKCKHLLRSLLENLEVIDFFPIFAAE